MAEANISMRQGEARDIFGSLTATQNEQINGTPLFFLTDDQNHVVTTPTDYTNGVNSTVVTGGPALTVNCKYKIDATGTNVYPPGWYTGRFAIVDTGGHTVVDEVNIYIAPVPDFPWNF